MSFDSKGWFQMFPFSSRQSKSDRCMDWTYISEVLFKVAELQALLQFQLVLGPELFKRILCLVQLSQEPESHSRSVSEAAGPAAGQAHQTEELTSPRWFGSPFRQDLACDSETWRSAPWCSSTGWCPVSGQASAPPGAYRNKQKCSRHPSDSFKQTAGEWFSKPHIGRLT